MQKLKKSEMVAAKLRNYIISKRLKPGDRLPTEGELADRFQVSRVSVREATKALGFLGILDSAPRRGLTVGKVSMKRLSRYLSFHFAVADYPVDELIDTRIVVETGGLRQVAERMAKDPMIYAQLHAVNDKLRGVTKKSEWLQGEVKFHCLLVSSSGVRALAAFNDLVQVFFRKFRADFSPTRWKEGVQGHQDIIDVLRLGDYQKATELLTAHINVHRDWKKKVKKNARQAQTAESNPSEGAPVRRKGAKGNGL
ncbi:MAG TPA: GntR family transcriptional regulator [Lacipirellulaceae bacterium]|nr:GntR family transcriptional regulator [Lacipirellulaceae bacterium]HMP05143.1 GntR family transcriptional regulator [Lacipirellulaceae bacterium]